MRYVLAFYIFVLLPFLFGCAIDDEDLRYFPRNDDALEILDNNRDKDSDVAVIVIGNLSLLEPFGVLVPNTKLPLSIPLLFGKEAGLKVGVV